MEVILSLDLFKLLTLAKSFSIVQIKKYLSSLLGLNPSLFDLFYAAAEKNNPIQVLFEMQSSYLINFKIKG